MHHIKLVMYHYAFVICSRKEWKKLRRKKKRQADAQARDIEEQGTLNYTICSTN